MFFSLRFVLWLTWMAQAPVDHFKTTCWHTSDFLPTVIIRLRHKLLSEYSPSQPFWHMLCASYRLKVKLACFGEHCTGAHTHFSLRNSGSCADCAFNILLKKMSRNLATVKTSFYNGISPIELILTLSLGFREERTRTAVNGKKKCGYNA